MSLVEQATGTQAATLTTEHTLATLTNGKTYVLVVDANALAAGEVLELTAYVKPLSGSTARVAYRGTFVGPLASPVLVSPPVPAVHSVGFTLKQTGGTGRSYDFSIVSLD